MALIKCLDCGTDVSDAAPVCPKCGRPAAVGPFIATPSRDVQPKVEKKRSGTVSITLSSFAVMVIGIAIAVCFVPALQIGQSLQAQCKINGLGSGTCQFTNTGWTPGSQCIAVRLVNKKGGFVSSGPLCSGRVWPNDTAQKDVSMVVGDTCSAPDASWSDVCEMDIHNLTGGADDEAFERNSASPPAQAPSETQAATVGNVAPLATAGMSSTGHTITSPDPFDENAVIQQMPASADGSGKPITPILVFSSTPFSEGGKTFRYVIVSYATSGDCHACSVTLGAAIFVKVESSWVLKSWDASLMTSGENGVFGTKAEKFSLGEHSGVILQGSGVGQGVAYSYATVLGESGGKLAAVWTGRTAWDETGTGSCAANSCANWSSVLKRLPTSKNGWTDLQLQTTGVGDRADKSFGSINKTETLQFDGTKYVTTSTDM
jgi:hypothetical protein